MNRTKSSPGMERLVAVAAGLALIAAACGGGNAGGPAGAGHGSPPAVAVAAELASLRLAAADVGDLTGEELCDLLPTTTLELDRGKGIPDAELRYGPGADDGVHFCWLAFGGWDDEGVRVNAGGTRVSLYLSPDGAAAAFETATSRDLFKMAEIGIGERFARAVDGLEGDEVLVALRGPFMMSVAGSPDDGDLERAMREIDQNVKDVIARLGDDQTTSGGESDDAQDDQDADGDAGRVDGDGAGGEDDGQEEPGEESTVSIEDIALDIMASGYAGGTEQLSGLGKILEIACGRAPPWSCHLATAEADAATETLRSKAGLTTDGKLEELSTEQATAEKHVRAAVALANLVDESGTPLFPGVLTCGPVLRRLGVGGVRDVAKAQEALRFMLAQLIGRDMLGWSEP